VSVLTRISAAATVIAVLVFGASHGHADTPAVARTALVVWTYVTGPLDVETRDAGFRLADHLLATAGVTVHWRLCGEPGQCDHPAGAPPRVTMILMAARRKTCGETMRDPDQPGGTIVISIGCIESAARTIRGRLRSRTHPLLSTLDASHLLGAVVAHEIGHVLGTPHTGRGIMRAKLEVDDIVALRQGRLAFDPIQATRMRIAAAIEPLAVRTVRR
jgi:hypothetical protein